MKKVRLSVYLDPKLAKQLEAYANERRRSLSVVAQASIASFLSPDGPDRMEAVMAKRLDRMSRQIERLNRDTGISLETLALFIRHWLVAVPAPSEAHYAAAQAKGRERYERFLEALGRRLSKGPTLLREVSIELPSAEGQTDLGSSGDDG
ncbi:CopG family transcriptional regulator [Roseomonas fluvialis]|uniref:CopG family transcriptional regulator n=1 Tax=Roseomonas fluvialis TaxID=1750527 RepID=A0ABN6P7L0_9PROT|nr:CopG family transcriptional regulator [Roseomonas fluvialis]BDG74415.1 CopG family transcriptional regulator [Roseomonas fluvialis]